MSTVTGLLPCQKEAVNHVEGPLLVLAGPGSGKTRVITRRIARLVNSGVDSREILAITFTNKAAEEMATRVNDLLPKRFGATISTFHRFCARLLRQWAPAIGLEPNYSIFDTADQRRLLRSILHDLDFDVVHFSPEKIGAKISRAKNDLQSAAHIERKFQESVGDHVQAVVARVYTEYQRRLLDANAVDFDDLLMHVVTLLSENPEVRARLDRQYRFVLVDEYQDTNLAQYRIALALSQDYPNLCVTGDPDQSIYGWRGAQIDNILRFERDFPDAKVVKLEQNFRSTKAILRAADQLIARNVHRKKKSLFTDNDEGDPVELLCFADGRYEARGIAEFLRQEVESGRRTWSDFALFYRVNALSRELERALARQNIPFQVVAGMAFFERAEIKDMLAYLRLIHNPRDDAAFLRVVNTPLRGIGKSTQAKLANWAREQRLSLFEAAERAEECPSLSKRAVKLLSGFASLMTELSLANDTSVEDLLRRIDERAGFTQAWRVSQIELDQQRLANVEELLTAAREFDNPYDASSALEAFLESTSLTNEADDFDEQAGKVTLMTLHAAKGLEFPVVFIAAVEQNLIPHERSVNQGDIRELEEERRLLFVGMTRAQEQLFLTKTDRRHFRGRRWHTIPSDFLFEMEIVQTDRSDAYIDDSEFWDEEDADNTGGENGDSLSDPISLPTMPADGASESARPGKSSSGFVVGTTVRHPQYGLGTIVETKGDLTNRSVTVTFEGGQCGKTFVVAKSPLQPVGTS